MRGGRRGRKRKRTKGWRRRFTATGRGGEKNRTRWEVCEEWRVVLTRKREREWREEGERRKRERERESNRGLKGGWLDHRPR